MRADLRLPGDRCLRPQHLPGRSEVAPGRRQPGLGSGAGLHPGAHGVPGGDGGAARAGVRAWHTRTNEEAPSGRHSNTFCQFYFIFLISSSLRKQPLHHHQLCLFSPLTKSTVNKETLQTLSGCNNKGQLEGHVKVKSPHKRRLAGPQEKHAVLQLPGAVKEGDGGLRRPGTSCCDECVNSCRSDEFEQVQSLVSEAQSDVK